MKNNKNNNSIKVDIATPLTVEATPLPKTGADYKNDPIPDGDSSSPASKINPNDEFLGQSVDDLMSHYLTTMDFSENTDAETTEVAEVIDEVGFEPDPQEETNAVDPQTYVIRLLEGIYLNTQQTAQSVIKSSNDEEKYLQPTKVDYDKLDEANRVMGEKYSSALADNRDLKNTIVDINYAIMEAFNEDGIDDINIPTKFSFWWVVSNASSIFTLVKKIVTIVKENKQETKQKFASMLESNRIKL